MNTALFPSFNYSGTLKTLLLEPLVKTRELLSFFYDYDFLL